MISSIRDIGVKYDAKENIFNRAVEEPSDISDHKKDNHKGMFKHPIPDEDFEIRTNYDVRCEIVKCEIVRM